MMAFPRLFPAKAVMSAIALLALAACGGGGAGGPAGQAPPPEAAQPSPPPDKSAGTGNFLGIGPAFAGQSPSAADLPAGSETARSGIRIRSGSWRDPQGRDGSRSAAEVIGFLRSFQAPAYRDDGPEADLLVVDFGGRKILRLQGAAARERKLVGEAAADMNAALPWDMRILLGDDLSRRIAPAEVPHNEIHLHFTDGKATWPSEYMAPEDGSIRILGIGGANVSLTNFMVLGGFAYIDRRAMREVGLDEAETRGVITHEILHAYGIGAHADPERFPMSVLSPTAENLATTPPVYLSIDGEGILALARIPPGTPVAGLGPDDLGDWADTGYHLLGYAPLGGGDDFVRFGAAWRNGLAKPWAYGPAPETRLRDNPALLGSAVWNGGLLGFSGAGRTVAGDARIRIDLGSMNGRAGFTGLESWAPETHPGQPGSGRVWGDGDLGYSIEVTQGRGGEGFASASAPGDDPGWVSGVFAGPAHQGAAGILEHPDLSAAFGGTR